MGRLLVFIAVLALVIFVCYSFMPDSLRRNKTSDDHNPPRPIGPDDDPEFFKHLDDHPH